MSFVLFTGAGASRPLGYPVTSEFFAEMTLKGEEQELLKLVCHRLGSTQDVLDVEKALWLLEPIENFVKSESGRLCTARYFTNNVQTTVPSLCTRIRRHCFDLYGDEPDEFEVEKLFLRLLDAMDWKRRPIPFFTTNYDPVAATLSRVATTRKLGFTDGFSNHTNEFSSENYAEVIDNGLKVYHLHGALNWVRGPRPVAVPGVPESSPGFPLRKSGVYKQYQEFDLHELIYPGYKGDPENDSHVHEGFSFSHKELRRALGVGDVTLVVIGFSFRDDHLNDIVSTSFRSNKNLRLVSISPEASANEMFEKLLDDCGERRVRALNMRFEADTVSEIANELTKNRG